MPDGSGPNGPSHDEDFYAWTQYQAEVLRALPTNDNRFDREHVAEEIEDLGNSERAAVRSEVRRVLEHLLKLTYSPAVDPRSDWIVSIINARSELEDRLTTTLRRDVQGNLDRLYRQVRDAAEAGLHRYGERGAAAELPSACPYTFDQIVTAGWYPTPSRDTDPS
jgi:hypothetical protein